MSGIEVEEHRHAQLAQRASHGIFLRQFRHRCTVGTADQDAVGIVKPARPGGALRLWLTL